MRCRATVSSKHQVTIPAEVRKRLGIGAGSKIEFIIDDDEVRLKPVTSSITDFFGFVPSRPGQGVDFDKEIDEAMAEQADRISRDLARS